MVVVSRDLPTADQLEEVFHAALRAGDAKDVDAALRLMAVQDPHRAELLLDMLQLALQLAGASS